MLVDCKYFASKHREKDSTVYRSLSVTIGPVKLFRENKRLLDCSAFGRNFGKIKKKVKAKLAKCCKIIKIFLNKKKFYY